jgi:superfamily II DNA helicase RecQ
MHRFFTVSKPSGSQRKRSLRNESSESSEGFEPPARKRARAAGDQEDHSVISSENSGSNTVENEPEASEQQESSSTLQHQPDSIEAKLSIARDILKDNFGYDDFKSEQENVIRALLSGENSLAILPTNAGKSLCYQLPALCFEALDNKYGINQDGKHGITLVISPLISLMTDQVSALQRNGIAANALNISKSLQEQKDIFSSLAGGGLKILFCSPEKLMNEKFVKAITSVPGGIRLLAVDEAHCIDEVRVHACKKGFH